MDDNAIKVSSQMWKEAYRLYESGKLKSLTNEEIGQEYKTLCDLIPKAPPTAVPGQARRDAEWVEWEAQYGARCNALWLESMRRRRI